MNFRDSDSSTKTSLAGNGAKGQKRIIVFGFAAFCLPMPLWPQSSPCALKATKNGAELDRLPRVLLGASLGLLLINLN